MASDFMSSPLPQSESPVAPSNSPNADSAVVAPGESTKPIGWMIVILQLIGILVMMVLLFS